MPDLAWKIGHCVLGDTICLIPTWDFSFFVSNIINEATEISHLKESDCVILYLFS